MALTSFTCAPAAPCLASSNSSGLIGSRTVSRLRATPLGRSDRAAEVVDLGRDFGRRDQAYSHQAASTHPSRNPSRVDRRVPPEFHCELGIVTEQLPICDQLLVT